MDQPHFETARIAELEAENEKLHAIQVAADYLNKAPRGRCLACTCTHKDHATYLEVALGKALYDYDYWKRQKNSKLALIPPDTL